MARIVGEVRPKYVFVENSPILTSRGLHRVLGDLAEMGFDARWGVVSAADVGAPHQRDRIWIAASNPSGVRSQKTDKEQGISSQQTLRFAKQDCSIRSSPFQEWSMGVLPSNLVRVDDGVAARVDRLKAIGNGQVPLVAATAWNLLK
jgi:DNA (cytosine-5)-methyltransferase 1